MSIGLFDSFGKTHNARVYWAWAIEAKREEWAHWWRKHFGVVAGDNAGSPMIGSD